MMEVITSKEFRDKQRFYFEKSREDGVVYVVNNGDVYSLRPTTELELYYANPKVQEDLATACQEIENGETYATRPDESLSHFLQRMREEGNV